MGAAFQLGVGIRPAAVAVVLLIAACSGSGNVAVHNSPSPSVLATASPSPSPSPSPTLAPSPSPTPSPVPSPVTVPAWAAMHASCSGGPAAQEALITVQGSNQVVLADVTDPVHPRTICTIAGGWSPQLVTQGEVSWWATQGGPDAPGPSVIATLDLFSGISAVAASWSGGRAMDGMHAWSPDQSTLVYLTSDPTAVNLHLLTGAGDRVLAAFGAVPGRGGSPTEDDSFLGFSPDGAYFALEQTFTSSGNQLVVWNRSGIVFSQANATMATWGSTGSKLFFRQPNASFVYVWDSSGPAGNRSPAFGQQFAWIRPRADAGDDYLVFTVRDSSGIPHVYLYGHGGRSGGQLPNERSWPSFLNSATVFLIEEAACGSNCGIGPATQPDGKTFTYNIATQMETPSTISSVLGAWPRPGQV